MREISIHLSKQEFELGEVVEGYVVIDCDETFDCNRVVIRLRGVETTRVVRGSGKHRRVYIEERVHLERTLVLKEFPIFQEGETGLDFKFELPQEIPASYEGEHGNIRYDLMAKIELSWRLDPKARLRIKVKHTLREDIPASQPVTAFVDDDGVQLLSVEALDNVLRLGESLAFSFRVDREVGIRGVRAELIQKEHVAPKGKKEISDRIMSKRSFDNENLHRELWIESDLQTNPTWVPTFTTALIKLEYLLKVTLDIPWRFDKSVEIPILIIPPGKTSEDEQVVEDYFGFEFE